MNKRKYKRKISAVFNDGLIRCIVFLALANVASLVCIIMNVCK